MSRGLARVVARIALLGLCSLLLYLPRRPADSRRVLLVAGRQSDGAALHVLATPPLPVSNQLVRARQHGTVPPALDAVCGLPPAPPLPTGPVRRIAVIGERHSGETGLCYARHRMSCNCRVHASHCLCCKTPCAGTNMMERLLNGTIMVADGVRTGVTTHKHWMQV